MRLPPPIRCLYQECWRRISDKFSVLAAFLHLKWITHSEVRISLRKKPELRRVRRMRPLLLLCRQEPRDPFGAAEMLANNDQRGSQRDCDESSRNAPNPAPESERQDDYDGRERKALSL